MSEYKKAFIHIPKNAGMSINKMVNRGQIPNIRYCFHNIDPHNITEDQIVILRDPADRFGSAVRYAIQYYSRQPQIKSIIDMGLTTPNDWAEALADPSHEHHDLVLGEVKNRDKNPHRIGKTVLEWKWTYSPQYLWYDNPVHVIMYDNLDAEMNDLMDKLGYPEAKIGKANSTRKSESEVQFSEKAMIFLKQKYEKDYELIAKHKSSTNMD